MYTEEQKRAHVRGLQADLRLIHATTGDILPLVTGIYDCLTEQAVRRFQEAHSLPVSGKTDLSTWDRIVHEANHLRSLTALPLAVRIFPSAAMTVRKGDRGRFVYILQGMLNGLTEQFPRLLPLPYTGVYDEETMRIVAALQKASQLPETGFMDAQTWNMLADLHSCAAVLENEFID